MNTFFVALGLEEAITKIEEIINASSSGERVDRYSAGDIDGKNCTVLVYEKYFYRVKNYLTLTITVDNFSEKTRVHVVSGGGGNGLFNMDWGASDSFASEIIDGLEQYKCE